MTSYASFTAFYNITHCINTNYDIMVAVVKRKDWLDYILINKLINCKLIYSENE